ncbi:MAG: hypothetical protein C5B49_02585 [Bdellovibrio sp.]|nr:MAG: hypothetical protein C5B49_02585 [Bdellovibrio sp.]
MVDDLLDYHRVESGKIRLKLQECNINSLLQECADMFVDIAAKKSIAVSVASSVPLVGDIDHDRILQVLSNLVANAVKFIQHGGQIILEAREAKSEIQIRVEDNGPGISSDLIPKIFKRFSQLDQKDRTGLGLGLYISQAIVESHGGRIHVQSELGKGANFVVSIPLAAKQTSEIDFSHNR